MRMPAFTAEAGLRRTAEHYAPVALAQAGEADEFRPALIAPPPDDGVPVCQTSGCFRVGGCRTRVRCCRILGGCTCTPVPCFFKF